MHQKTFPQISTERLLLRKIEVTDAQVILFLRFDHKINTYIERPEHRKTRTLDQAKPHIKKLNTQLENDEYIAWGITIAGIPKLIGSICLWNFSEDRKTAEVGYDLDSSFQKKGIMSEALKAVLDFGFYNKGFETIEACKHKDNEASKKLLVNNGFLQNVSRIDKDNLDNAIFELKK